METYVSLLGAELCSKSDIACRIGVSIHTMARWVKNAGLPINKYSCTRQGLDAGDILKYYTAWVFIGIFKMGYEQFSSAVLQQGRLFRPDVAYLRLYGGDLKEVLKQRLNLPNWSDSQRIAIVQYIDYLEFLEAEEYGDDEPADIDKYLRASYRRVTRDMCSPTN